MSAKQKKNVYNEFMQEDYVPRPHQRIVRYVSGRGNNLHQVRDHTSSGPFLVSMPKKYRGTLWLKRDDCLVIDPIPEGNKVVGEIVCLMPLASVGELIRSGGWPESGGARAEDSSVADVVQERQALLHFFAVEGPGSASSNSSLPMSESNSDLDEEEEVSDEEETSDSASSDNTNANSDHEEEDN